MKYTAQHYGELLFDLTDGKSADKLGAVIKRFVRLLQKHNSVSLYKKILIEFSQIYNKKHGISGVKIVSARLLNEVVQKKIEKNLPQPNSIEYSIDTTLIGGIKVIINNSILVDGSIKKRIDNIFKA